MTVGQNPAALDSLHDLITSKRSKQAPLASLEPIMIRFVELSVELRKGKIAKDGLYQYKNIAQNTSVGSIEVVLKKFIELSEAKVTEAQAQAEKITLDNIDDLEATETPESLILATVSAEQSRDRTDRAVVTPWLKFLWETYRTVLDILRNNSRLEQTYQATALQAFNFCLKYTRKTEFRRLCEILRNHLVNASKYPNQPHSINLNEPETLQRHLDTRFQQLNAAVELELWQEAFRSVEDIHNLLNMAKRPPKPIMMANYYEKLTKIFLVANNYLFHAAAWSRLYNLRRDLGKLGTQEEQRKLASFVLMAILSIPVIGARSSKSGVVEIDDNKQKSNRLAALLGFAKAPSRASLLRDVIARGILSSVSTETLNLYNILEVNFHPLVICEKINPLIVALSKDVETLPYVKPLRQVILTRLFQQLSQVYESVQFDFILKLAIFAEPVQLSPSEIEHFIMDACKKDELAIRVDHATGIIYFSSDIFLTSRAVGDASVRLQSTPAELVRTQLSRLGQCLYATLNEVDPTWKQEKLTRRDTAVQRLKENAESDVKAIKARAELIEQRRELIETLAAQKTKHEASERAERLRREQAAEEKRVQEDLRRREAERLQREQKRIRESEAKKFAAEIASRTNLGIDVNELAGLDTDRLRELELQTLDKNAREMEDRLLSTAKYFDHLERAVRKEEIPLVNQDYERQKKLEKEAFAQGRVARLAAAKAAHQDALALKARLGRIMVDYEAYRSSLIETRKDQFEKRKVESAAALEREKEKRRQVYRKRVLADRQRAADEALQQEEERLAIEHAEAERIRIKEEQEASAAAAKNEREEQRRWGSLMFKVEYAELTHFSL